MSNKNKYAHLFTPFKIGKVTVRNRFAVAPMSLGFYIDHLGGYNDLGKEHYISQAKGGFGLIFTGAFTCDNKVDPYNPLGQNWFAGEDGHVRATAAEMVDMIHMYGSAVFAQVTLGTGRNWAGNYAPSEVPVFNDPGVTSKPLTKAQIKAKIQTMIDTSKGVKAAGFDGIDIHALHNGYTLDDFALSVTNHRTDEYGGSLENRLRICRELVEGIKEVCGQDFAVTMRLGMKSYLRELGETNHNRGRGSITGEGEIGRTLEEGIEIAKLLEKYGYDGLSVDTGVYESNYYCIPPMYVDKGYAIELAAEMKKHVNIPLILAGRMNDVDMASEGLKEGKYDCIALGRPSLADMEYPNKVMKGIPEKIRPCIACNAGCIGAFLEGHNVGCAVNPEIGHEKGWCAQKTLEPKNVLVVGGGVAGMEVARTATMRGHRVSLYEKTDRLGGQLIPAGAHDFKKDIDDLNKWYQLELKDLGIDIHLNEALDPDKIRKLSPDTVVFAVGAEAKMPEFKGRDSEKVATSIDVLTDKKPIGDKVVVVGGGQVGCEIALDCIHHKKDVSIVVGSDRILSYGVPLPIYNSMYIDDSFYENDTPIFTGFTLEEVNEKGAVIRNRGGEEKTLEADTVIIAKGFAPVTSMAQELLCEGMEVYEVGDGRKVGSILTSIWSAYDCAKRI
ncbi:MAG TPA: FAD-dependent oxidoreductase [Candidatus Copromorpha excrementigallinarum]|uniref:FAD-dependent oxidoreductase n=1 Tax=Candidatus Allocopromorpha excrementigallinarum TaxID=2840742 RepID=A0A9D1L5R9_9FIRM|nr:FAD-dependent oxidoreductase [Candidatus Copromorpha excrementigallinarum]